STVTYQTASTFHVRGWPDTAAALRRLAALLSSHESRPTTTMVGDLITMGVRHIIGMMSVPEKGGKRVVEISEILPYEPQERRIPYIVIAQWEPKTDTWRFHGITEAMAHEADVQGYAISGLPVQANPEIRYVYL
ncbi:MAG: CpaF family protein, partial [Alicyclobacillus sp.]|nr:CpaF family protein [Alicyclobacillus sp.]